MLSRTFFARLWKILVVVTLALSTSACLIYWTKTGNAEDPKNDNSILVYGYLDDQDAPFSFRWGQLRQAMPRTDEPFHDLKLNKEGLFYLDNLPVGSYAIESLGGPDRGLIFSGFFADGTWKWRFPNPSQRPEFKLTELRATKPGLHFMGAYRVFESKKGGLLSTSEYSSAAVESPSELEILEQLREKTRDSKWDRLVVARINELKRSK